MSEDRYRALGREAGVLLAGGAPLGGVLLWLRDVKGLRAIEIIAAFREATDVSLSRAKSLVDRWWSGSKIDHIGMREIERIVAIPRVSGIAWWLYNHLEDSILENWPYLVITPGNERSVKLLTGATPEPKIPGWISGDGCSMEPVREEVRFAAREWHGELELLRDTPPEILVRFRRAARE